MFPAPNERPEFPLGLRVVGAQGELAGADDACEYGFSGVAVWCGLLPSSSDLFCEAITSSRAFFNESNCSRNEVRSVRKDLILSCAFSFLAAFNSDVD